MNKTTSIYKAVLACLVILLLFTACTTVAAPAASSPTSTTKVEPTTIKVEAPAPTSTTQPKSEEDSWKKAQFPETNPYLSVSYNPTLVNTVTVSLIEALPVNSEGLFSAFHPAYVKFSIDTDIHKGSKVYLLEDGPQVKVYQTRDMAGYAGPEGSIFTYPNITKNLSDLLKQGLNPDICGKPFGNTEFGLPFLPTVNAKQVFCAQVKEISFEAGKGIRYLTYYSQGPVPVADFRVFYTFQGLTDDGQYYVMAMLPVHTGVFPEEETTLTNNEDMNNRAAQLKEQVNKLNTQPEENFDPALTKWDQMMSKIKVGE